MTLSLFCPVLSWRTADEPLGDASLSSLGDARQCIPAERKSVDVDLSTLCCLFIAALFSAFVCCAYRTHFCFAFIVRYAFGFCTSVIEGLRPSNSSQAFRERLDPKLGSRPSFVWGFSLLPHSLVSAQQAKSPNAPSVFLNVGSVATRVQKVASFLGREGFGAQRGYGGLRHPFR